MDITADLNEILAGRAVTEPWPDTVARISPAPAQRRRA